MHVQPTGERKPEPARPREASEGDALTQPREFSLARREILSLQRSVGNAVVQRWLADAGYVHRDLAAYTTAHVETDDGGGGMEGPPITTVTTADAPALTAALRDLVSAGKISSRTRGDTVVFSEVTATRAELLTALTAAGFPRAVQMADALLEQHRISVYSRDQVQHIPGLFGGSSRSIGQQNIDAQSRRGLTGFEQSEAMKVYGGSLNWDAIVLEDAPVMAVGGYARTTPWTVNFPSGTVANNSLDMPWLIHELGHSWEYARGVSMIRTLYHAVRGVYDYGGAPALRAATAAGRGLNSFNTEQQADIAKDAYLAVNSRVDLPTYQPFIDEFKSGHYK